MRPPTPRPPRTSFVRGGFIRQVGAGLFTFLPLGWRVHQKVVQVIREEIDAIGGQEMLGPVLTPAELWRLPLAESACRSFFRLQDSGGRRFVLPMSHEETMTFHARELKSYKQLPQLWYHFSTKERDEPRARGGLLRVREFIMKDSYCSTGTRRGSTRASSGTPRRTRASSSAAASRRTSSRRSPGSAAAESSGFLATGSGENELMRCENGDYFADIEAARGVPRAPEPRTA